MKFLSNIYDPSKPDASRTVTPSIWETEAEAWQHQLDWLKGKIIGRPQATKTYSVEELEAKGYVGVYKP